MSSNRFPAFILLLLILFSGRSFAGEENLVNLAGEFYNNHEYFYSITETKRYEFLYPEGDYMPDMLLLRGKAYLMGDNYSGAISSFGEVFQRFPETEAGEEALYMSGYSRMIYGSMMFAARDIRRYLNIYPDGVFSEEARRDICYVTALSMDLPSAQHEIERYIIFYPDGRYRNELEEVNEMIIEEMNRPRKSPALSFAGSLVFPGFGHFYTGKIKEGFLSLASTSLFLYLTIDGFTSGDRLRGLLFGFITLNFYQYSLTAAVSNVYEYNSSRKFEQKIKIQINGRF